MIISYKIHFAHERARIVVDTGDNGIDVVGEGVARIARESQPLIDWLRARDPSAIVRALYVHPRVPRAIVSLEPPQGPDTKPWVLRLDAQDASAFLASAPGLLGLLEQEAADALQRRRLSPTPARA